LQPVKRREYIVHRKKQNDVRSAHAAQRKKEVLMARVTVEDCLDHVQNRFALVHATAQRTKQLYKHAKRLINCKNKEIVCALREIADEKVVVTPSSSPEEKVQRKPRRHK